MGRSLGCRNKHTRPSNRQLVRLSHSLVSRSLADMTERRLTAEGDRLQSPAEKAQTIKDHPKPEQPVVKQNDALQRFIERTRRDLEDKERNSRS